MNMHHASHVMFVPPSHPSTMPDILWYVCRTHILKHTRPHFVCVFAIESAARWKFVGVRRVRTQSRNVQLFPARTGEEIATSMKAPDTLPSTHKYIPTNELVLCVCIYIYMSGFHIHTPCLYPTGVEVNVARRRLFLSLLAYARAVNQYLVLEHSRTVFLSWFFFHIKDLWLCKPSTSLDSRSCQTISAPHNRALPQGWGKTRISQPA